MSWLIVSNVLAHCCGSDRIAQVFPEGFVIRVTRAFPTKEFESAVGKYVRAGHVQTKDDFRRNWQPSVDRTDGQWY